MKKIKLIISIYILTLSFACTDNDLDVIPKDRYTDVNFWTTENNAVAALNGCYAVLRNIGMFDGGAATPLIEDAATPNGYSKNNRLGYDYIASGNQTSVNTAIFRNRWFDSYRGIGRCNSLLTYIDKIPMSDSKRTQIKAEATFLRAFYYSMLTTYYGSVPLILTPPNIQEHNLLPKTDRSKIIEQIIIDLDHAASILPLKYVGKDIGRATKGAALSLKARVLLFEASPLINSGDVGNPVGDVDKWVKAADAAQAVIDIASRAGYSLFPNYRNLFLAENENSAESIFDVQFKVPEQGSSFDVNNRQWNYCAPLRDFIDAYEMREGFTYNPSKPYENRDPRMYQTIVYPGDIWMGNVTTPTTPFPSTGYGVKKYTIYDKEPSTNIITEGRSDINYMIIRYADILLMYAEAKNEVLNDPSLDTNPTMTIYNAINLVRKRAGIAEVPSGKTKEEMREIIRHERRIEFAFEGLYYNDIRRWRTAEVVMNAKITDSQNNDLLTRTFNPSTDYWWHIPQDQVDINPNLK
jgi:hypothetical protein